MLTKKRTTVFLTLIALGGCRFGNYSEAPKGTSNFTSIELYRTQPTQFKTYAFLNDGSYTSNLQTPLSAIPENVLDNFTDPLYLVEAKSTPGIKMFIGSGQTSCFTDPDNATCINTIIDPDNTIGVQLSNSFSQFGPNPNCLMNLEMQQIGALDKRNPSTIRYSDGSTARIEGRLLLEFQMVRNFQGDCSSILTLLAQCYTNGTGCSTDQLYWANQLFDLYVRQSQVLNIQDASRVQSLVYILSLE